MRVQLPCNRMPMHISPILQRLPVLHLIHPPPPILPLAPLLFQSSTCQSSYFRLFLYLIHFSFHLTFHSIIFDILCRVNDALHVSQSSSLATILSCCLTFRLTLYPAVVV